MSVAVKVRVLNRPIVCVIFCPPGEDWLAICHQATASDHVPPLVVKLSSGMTEDLLYLTVINRTAVGMPGDRLYAVAAIIVSAGIPLKTGFLKIDGFTRGVQRL